MANPELSQAVERGIGEILQAKAGLMEMPAFLERLRRQDLGRPITHRIGNTDETRLVGVVLPLYPSQTAHAIFFSDSQIVVTEAESKDASRQAVYKGHLTPNPVAIQFYDKELVEIADIIEAMTKPGNKYNIRVKLKNMEAEGLIGQAVNTAVEYHQAEQAAVQNTFTRISKHLRIT
jgi:hypothetical protein